MNLIAYKLFDISSCLSNCEQMVLCEEGGIVAKYYTNKQKYAKSQIRIITVNSCNAIVVFEFNKGSFGKSIIITNLKFSIFNGMISSLKLFIRNTHTHACTHTHAHTHTHTH